MNDQTNLDSLLDISLDDLADLPEFLVFPAGAHRCTVNFETKKIGEHPAVEVKLTLLEVMELSNASDTPPETGAESSCAYMLDNEFGQGNFKKLMTPLGQHFGVNKLSEIVEAAKGMEAVVVTKQRKNKDKTQTYLDIVSITPV